MQRAIHYEIWSVDFSFWLFARANCLRWQRGSAQEKKRSEISLWFLQLLHVYLSVILTAIFLPTRRLTHHWMQSIFECSSYSTRVVHWTMTLTDFGRPLIWTSNQRLELFTLLLPPRSYFSSPADRIWFILPNSCLQLSWRWLNLPEVKNGTWMVQWVEFYRVQLKTK